MQVAEHCTDGGAAYLRQAGQRHEQGRPTDEPFHLAQCDEMRFHGHREYSDEQDSQYPIDFVDVPTSEQGQDRTRRHQEEHVCAESRGHGEDERESGPGREGSRRMGGDSVQRRAQRERDHVHQTGEHGCDVKIGVRRRGEQYRNDEGQHRSGHLQRQVEGVVLQGASAQVTQHLYLWPVRAPRQAPNASQGHNHCERRQRAHEPRGVQDKCSIRQRQPSHDQQRAELDNRQDRVPSELDLAAKEPDERVIDNAGDRGGADHHDDNGGAGPFPNKGAQLGRKQRRRHGEGDAQNRSCRTGHQHGCHHKTAAFDGGSPR